MDPGNRFSELYRAHYEAVLRYALRRTDPETAREVAAETFLVAWRRINAVPAEPGQSGPWLYGVARRVLVNADRSRRRGERLSARLGQQRQDDRSPDLAGQVTERVGLEQALAGLPASDQEALRLVGWEELDLAEAAAAMGCSRSTMAVRLHRARRRLERALAAADLPGSRSVVCQVAPVSRISQETP